MSSLFKTLPANMRRSRRFELRLTHKELKAIQLRAAAKNLSVSEFMRQTSLSRKADVELEIHWVRQIKEIINGIRDLRIKITQGYMPSEQEFPQLIKRASSVIHQMGS